MLHQGNREALQENIAPIFASKALILDSQGICPSGHSHTSLQECSLQSSTFVGTRCKTFDAVLDRDENHESSLEIMQSSMQWNGKSPEVIFLWIVCWIIFHIKKKKLYILVSDGA